MGFGDRTAGLVGELGQAHVLVAGAGSVGSALADALVRAGVGHVTLVDPDRVTGPNLARSVYTAADLGDAKVTALARHLRAVNPAAEVTGLASSLHELAEDGVLDPLVINADLVVAATDDTADQGLLGHHAYHRRVPMVACALYQRAAAGEVVIVDPGRSTPCWRCSIGQGAADRPPKDYGTGRLVAELALGPPIAIVAQMAAIIAIGLLAGPERPAGVAVAELLASGRNLGVIATTPGWEFFLTLFDGLESHQFDPQSVWATVERDPSCAVCGDIRTPPPPAGAGARGSRQCGQTSATSPHPRPAPVSGAEAAAPRYKRPDPCSSISSSLRAACPSPAE